MLITSEQNDLINSFITGVLYVRFKLIYPYSNKGDKVLECYSCLKMITQAHLHVGFFTIFLFNLNDSIYCCNQVQFLNKKIIIKCLAIKIFVWIFFIPNFQWPIWKSCNNEYRTIFNKIETARNFKNFYTDQAEFNK